MRQTEITVYTWKFNVGMIGDRERRIDADTGHSALKIKTIGDSSSYYFSWWPSRDRSVVGGFRHYVERQYKGDKSKMRLSYYEGENHADGKYRFSSDVLDCERMKFFLEELRDARTTTSWLATKGWYHKTIQNCSSVIAWALWEGGCGRYARWPGHFMWHPNNLAFYCRELVQGVCKIHGSEHATIVRDMDTASPGPGVMELAKKVYFNK